MDSLIAGSHDPQVDPEVLASRLRQSIAGDVRFDRLSRAIYATDASIYEIEPLGVVFPRSVEDVVATVNVCRDSNVPLVPRGAGTGLAGGAVGAGIQLDLSRHMQRVSQLDVAARTVAVQPGVVLDELNAILSPHGLHFAPDVATSSRATIGGMIANNSCGANSIVFGRTVDHVLSLTVVLSDGMVVTWHRDGGNSNAPLRAQQICDGLTKIRDDNFDEICSRFPKVMRSNGGYGLDRLGPPGTPVDPTRILCGSEGTLGVIVEARLALVARPRAKGLIVLHFDDLIAALRATPAIIRHSPSAIELIDKLIVDAGRLQKNSIIYSDFLQGDPAALLVVEFFGESDSDVHDLIQRLASDPDISKVAFATSVVNEIDRQANVWRLRTSGLGLLMSRPGDEQPYSFIEDTAVDPSRLADYIQRLMKILNREDVHAGYYAHASVGCIHVKPVLNLKRSEDVARLHRIAGAVADLALEFGGAFTGEHGDGIVRSSWLEKMYGPRIVDAFRYVKHLFDPHKLFNPGKIVDPLPMTENLRYGSDFRSLPVKTYFDYSEHGGPAELAAMCSGVGQCRQRLVGTMCPSFMATGDEQHTTRARANALRMALSNRPLLSGLDDPALDEVMDLCIGCKACKTECPTGVDMAKLKAEFLARRNLTRGASARAQLIADFPRRLAGASRFPRGYNFLAQNMIVRKLIDKRYALDARVPPPKLARQTFQTWWRKRLRKRSESRISNPRAKAVYFVDTWTNYICPEVGIAAVKVMEQYDVEVACPQVGCCGRPSISQGMLAECRDLASHNIERLQNWVARGYLIVGTEPSCLLTLLDEYPQLVRTQAARRVAKNALLLETFLAQIAPVDSGNAAPQARRQILYHGHCHQKALVGTSHANELLNRAFAGGASEINSGCCGMAGAFGHESEHYEISRAIGEQRLFPAVRARGNADVAISGFSCRHQIEHHTGVRPKHWIEFVAESISANP